MNYRKLLLASILGGSLLTGCATLDGFLADLGLKNTDKVEQVAITPINENYVFVKTANVRIAPLLVIFIFAYLSIYSSNIPTSERK